MASSTASICSHLKPQLPSLPQADPSINPNDLFRLAAAQFLASVVPEISLSTAFDAIETGKKDSDLVVPIPKFRLKLKIKPQELAQNIANAFESNDYLSEVGVLGVVVTFKIKTSTLANVVLNQINELTYLADKPSYGCNTSGKGKKAIIEYAAPNIAKPFHAGHLRSTIIGAFLCNLYEANSWQVHKINYLGDWGKQFGLLTIGFRKYGDRKLLEEDPIKHLFEVYVKINSEASAEVKAEISKQRAERRAAGEENVLADDVAPTNVEERAANALSPTHNAAREVFEKMENDDQEALALWKEFRELSIVKYEEMFGRLNVFFDEYLGEASVSRESQNNALNLLQQKSLVSEDKGAQIIDLTKYKLEKSIVRKRDGTTTYISRDIGGAVERWEKHKFDKMIYVIASQQSLHCAQFFKVLELMGYEWADRLEHINFGMVMGMSTRKGNVVFLEQILDDAQDRMHEQMKQSADKYSLIDDPMGTADNLGMSAVKIQDMAGKRYLQYAHVRLCSIIRNSEDVTMPAKKDALTAIDTEILSEPKAREVLMIMAAYPDAVKAAMKNSEPCAIVGFCWKLTHAISSAYDHVIVRGQDPEVAQARLYFYICARDVLSSAMRLLTLVPLERM